MTKLSEWLAAELERRGISQKRLANDAGVGQATISSIITKGHVPRVDLLFRLADHLGISHIEILHLAGYLQHDDELLAEIEAAEQTEPWVHTLLEQFRQVPDEWKPVAIDHIRTFVRLSRLPPYRLIPDPAQEDTP